MRRKRTSGQPIEGIWAWIPIEPDGDEEAACHREPPDCREDGFRGKFRHWENLLRSEIDQNSSSASSVDLSMFATFQILRKISSSKATNLSRMVAGGSEQTSHHVLIVDRRPRLLVPYLETLLEPMLKNQRASVFLALTVALTITVTWGP